ncbi:DUF3426 domain-containing protein [Luteimonas vadosa]|uniref:DUF3426 domain-containing protein n=1 Tax=Luteimonas vadosa TaxID=1165507 RepID=A0ABP9DWT5_9GAMM
MFVHCPHCQTLVATDPATGEPPDRCPRCGEPILGPAARTDADTAQGAEADGGHDTPIAPDRPEEDDAAPASPAGKAPARRKRARSGPDDPPPARARVASGKRAAGPGRQKAVDAPAAATASPLAPDGMTQAEGGNPPTRDTESATGTEADARTAAGIDAAEDSTGDDGHEDRPEPQEMAEGSAVPSSGTAAECPPVPSAQPSGRAPGFALARAPSAAGGGRRRWQHPALIAGLALLLGLQWTLADRQRLAADARWRPLVVRLCGLLGCEVPAWREPAAFVLLERDVRPHPRRPGVLRVTASFRNTAHWAQPWPEVVLTLSDIEGNVVGRRAFAAAQYHGDKPTQETIGSGQETTLRLDVIEPAPRSVAFAFDFR